VEPLRGAEASEAALAAALSLADALEVLLVDPPSLDATSAVAGAALGRPSAPGPALRAVRSPCPLGGSVDVDCRERGGLTIFDSELTDCVAADESGRVFTSSGRLSLALEAAGLCGLPIPDGIAATTEMRNFSSITEDVAGVLEELAVPRLTQHFTPSATGCSGRDGITTLAGRLMARRAAGQDVDLETDELVLTVRSRGNPCRQSAEVAGDIALRDRRRGRDFDLDAIEIEVANEIGSAADGLIGFGGDIESPCFGVAEVVSEELLTRGAACPAVGAIAVGLDDGARVRASFSPAGMALDHGVDGIVDVESETCFAAANPCRR